jgi:hypothetical protein
MSFLSKKNSRLFDNTLQTLPTVSTVGAQCIIVGYYRNWYPMVETMVYGYVDNLVIPKNEGS